MLKAENLRKSYRDNPVVQGVGLEVNPGETVGLLGPNGAGKTTTFHILVGWIFPDAGAVFLNGENISRLPMYQRARRGLAYLPQEPSLFRRMTVTENLRAALEFLPISRAEQRRRETGVMSRLGLELLADRSALALSGGERRKVEIARSLLLEPSFLLLDEPFSGIDPITIQELRRIIRDLAAGGIGVLITDHNVRDTLAITDRSYLLFRGQVLFSGSSRELVASEDARRFYLGDAFTL